MHAGHVQMKEAVYSDFALGPTVQNFAHVIPFEVKNVSSVTRSMGCKALTENVVPHIRYDDVQKQSCVEVRRLDGFLRVVRWLLHTKKILSPCKWVEWVRFSSLDLIP